MKKKLILLIQLNFEYLISNYLNGFPVVCRFRKQIENQKKNTYFKEHITMTMIP